MESLLTLTIRASETRKIAIDYSGPLLVRWRILNPKRIVDLASLSANLEAKINTPIGFIPMASKSIPAGTSEYSPLAIIQYNPSWEWEFKSPKGFEVSQLCFVEYTNSLIIPTNNPPPATPAMAPSYNPPFIPSISLDGVEGKLDSLIDATGEITSAIGDLAAIAIQPETATSTTTNQYKINPWSGSIGNHLVIGVDSHRKFIKLAADPGSMQPTDKLLIAAGEPGRGPLPGVEGWQFDYELLPTSGGWYASDETDCGLDLYVWSCTGNTDPIFVTITQGF